LIAQRSLVAAIVFTYGFVGEARADEPSPPADATAEARQLYTRATQLVKAAQWYEALGLFEKSNQLHPHAVTLFNTAACERALGRYTRARALYDRILAHKGGSGDEAPPDALTAEVELHARELDALLAHAEVRIAPAEAALTVDGRPLEVFGEARGERVAWAGLAEQGAGRAAPAAEFELVADPGAHVVTITRAGYSPAVVRVTFAPGEHAALPLELERLPARLHIASDRDRAAVSLDGTDVGLAPLDLSRPPGTYRVVVQKRGFVPYRANVTLAAGQEASLRTPLDPLRVPLWKKWWFWTITGVVVTGVALGAYFGARAAEPPQLDGGGLQWVAHIH
jgi:hypothetical protein